MRRYVTVLGAIALALVVVAMVVPALAAPQPGPDQGPERRDGPGWRGDRAWRGGPGWRGGFPGMGLLFGLARLIVPIGLIWLGYLAITRLARPREDQALAVLRERYARGEITAEEYQTMSRTLG